MVVVPAGKFLMGSADSEIGALTKEYGTDYFKYEAPRHEVLIPKPFAVGKFTVTFDEWAACAAEGGCKSNPTPRDEGWGKGRQPAIYVSWNDAQEYVSWLNGKVGGEHYRLLSEAEWEYAARADTQTRYYWGDAIGSNNANCDGCGSQWDNKQTAPVGSFAANAFGLNDMAGNVWQWTQDCWNSDYSAKPDSLKANGGAWTTENCSLRVLRGGSWAYIPRALRAAARFGNSPGYHSRGRGVRLARTF